MAQYIVGIVITLIIFGIVINKVNSGRCFRYEYIIKTLIILGIAITCILVIIIDSRFILFTFVIYFVLMYLYLKYTIQRFYDLDLSGWYIVLTLIPVIGLFVTLYLYFKKGNCEINAYDKAIDYRKLFDNKHCIDIYDNLLIVDNEEYQYERHLNNYIVRISNYKEDNFFTEYLQKNFSVKEDQIRKTVEITKDEFQKIIENLELIVINNSFYMNIGGFRIFIRKEDFKHTLILDKQHNKITKELFDTFDFPGAFYEDEKYVYYRKINKQDLLKWVKNVA